MHPTGGIMSLQALNEDYQLEVAQKEAEKKQTHGFGKLIGHPFGHKGTTNYPDEKRLEELLLSFE